MATNGYDIVLVADGTYAGAADRNLSFPDAIVTLAAANTNGAILDAGGQSGRHARFQDGETPLTVLARFKLINGRAVNGGSIAIESGSSPSILQCRSRETSPRKRMGAQFFVKIVRPPP